LTSEERDSHGAVESGAALLAAAAPFLGQHERV